MDVTLYSTGCPKCKVLKQKLDETGIKYEINENEKVMLSLGITSVPVLSVNGILMDFSDTIKWLKKQR